MCVFVCLFVCLCVWDCYIYLLNIGNNLVMDFKHFSAFMIESGLCLLFCEAVQGNRCPWCGLFEDGRYSNNSWPKCEGTSSYRVSRIELWARKTFLISFGWRLCLRCLRSSVCCNFKFQYFHKAISFSSGNPQLIYTVPFHLSYLNDLPILRITVDSCLLYFTVFVWIL